MKSDMFGWGWELHSCLGILAMAVLGGLVFAIVTLCQTTHNEGVITDFCNIQGYDDSDGLEYPDSKYFDCFKVNENGVIVRSEFYDLDFAKEYMKGLGVGE